jgi:2-C-methyl-D-erythritol 2,4-cyclodiphosphate synthase
LGALALGDIGQHFPDTSDEFKGIDSKILLDRTYKMITERGYHLVNADITLLLQKPKIAPYVVKMRKVLAEVLDVAPDRVSVKATTTEGAGYIGREEGVAAYAVVIISE